MALLWEDDDLLRGVLCDALEELGLRVILVQREDELEATLERVAPDIVVTDGLSGTSRLSEAERTRLIALGTRVPTVLISGRPWAVEPCAASLGLAGVVAKPFDLTRLEAAIRHCLDNTRLPLVSAS